jgi:hypothetical protein
MRRIKVAFVACVSLLAVALSAPAAGAAADPAAPAGAAKTDLGKRGPLRAPAWECMAGYTCFYTEVGGGGGYWQAPGCGFWDLSLGWYQDRIFSINNRGSGVASVYNWTGHGFELKGWVYPGNTGNFPQNVGVDIVHITC